MHARAERHRRPGPWSLLPWLLLGAWGCDSGRLDAGGTPEPADARGVDGAVETDLDLPSDASPDAIPGDASLDAAPVEPPDVAPPDPSRDGAPPDQARDAAVDQAAPDPADAAPEDAGPVDAAPMADACAPRACAPRACGPAGDGCGGRLACGGCPSIAEACVDGTCAQMAEQLILERPGEFFVVAEAGARQTLRIEPGTEWAQITIDMFATHGGWREDLFDREILSHNLWGLSRIANRSFERYLLGIGAQIRTVQAGLRPRLLYYARVDLDERPAGQGHTAYTAFRQDFAWAPGTTYRLRAVLDVANREQRLEVMVDGAVVARVGGDIEYITPALTASGFTLDFAADETDHRDVSPVGWRFSDLRVTGIEAR